MILTIYILSLESRKHYLDRLLAILKPQLTDDVELLLIVDDGEKTIGAKRQDALRAATGQYIVAIDDDDLISQDYVLSILEALKSKPDCVGFRQSRTRDGATWVDAIYSLRFTKWQSRGVAVYERTPCHITPIKTAIARAVGFQSLNCEEDEKFAVGVWPRLKTESFIDKVLYVYEYRSVKTEKRNAEQPF